MNKESFDKYIGIIKLIDSYIRSIDQDNIDKYEEFYPFIDYDDILLYQDVERTTIINYTVGIILKSELDLKNDKNMFFVSMVSFILTIKYMTDCSVYKPYSFFIDFVRELNSVETIENNIGNNKTKFIQKIIRLERRLLNNINYFCKNEK